MKSHEKRTAGKSPERSQAADSPNNKQPDGAEKGPGALKHWRYLPACLLIAATLLAYLPVWRAGFIWDDDAYVTQNTKLHSLEGLRQIWAGATQQYYPLVYTSFWLEYHFWQLHPLGFHVVNVLLHAAAAVLFARILLRLQIPWAWTAAFLFALHPVCVESVAWITERKNVLSAVFYFAAAVAWLRFNDPATVDSAKRSRWRWYILALILYLAALLSKTVTCSLPVALLLVQWWKTGRLDRAIFLRLAPFFIIGAGLGLVTVWWEKHHVGAQGELWSFTFLDRCLIAGRAFWFYIAKLIWPSRLAFAYPRWPINTAVWWQWLFPLAALALVAGTCLMRRRIGRGPLTAVLFFGVTLMPALGFFDVYPMRFSFVADHFQYLACPGVLVLCAAVLHRFPRIAAGAVAVTLGVLTWQQCAGYRDVETLWRDSLARYPNSILAQSNLGGYLLEHGKTDEAIVHLQKALELDPDAVELNYNLGNAFAKKGRFEDAVVHLQKVVALQPRFLDAVYNLGNAYLQTGRLESASVCFAKALVIQPDDVMARNNLGSVLVLLGRFDHAIVCLEDGLRLHPDDARLHDNLGIALLRKGRIDEAISHFQKALQLRPDFRAANQDLGRAAWILATSPDASVRNGTRAMELARRVNQVSGGTDPVHLAIFAAACAEAGKFPEALAVAQQSLELAERANNKSLVESLRQQIELYQAGRPFHEAAVPSTKESVQP